MNNFKLRLEQWIGESGLLSRLEPVHPNTLSLCGLTLGFISALLLANGWYGICACTTFLAGLCDMLDGPVARHFHKTSRGGEALDSALDRYVDFFLLAAVIILWHQDTRLLSLALLALLGSFMISYTSAKAEILSLRLPPGAMKREIRYTCLWIGIAASACTTNAWPLTIAIAIIAIWANISAAHRVWYLTRYSD